MQAARGAGARRGVGSSSSSSGGSAGPMWMLLVLGVLLLGFVGVARAERGVGATKGFGLLDRCAGVGMQQGGRAGGHSQ